MLRISEPNPFDAGDAVRIRRAKELTANQMQLTVRRSQQVFRFGGAAGDVDPGIVAAQIAGERTSKQLVTLDDQELDFSSEIRSNTIESLAGHVLDEMASQGSGQLLRS